MAAFSAPPPQVRPRQVVQSPPWLVATQQAEPAPLPPLSAASLCQHTKVAVPVGAWRWHQRGDAVDQFQRCEVQLICLGTTLVTGGLAALFGTAVHQFASLFA